MPHKHVHFLGIGGVGMAGVAILTHAQGAHVTGCDLKLSARTQDLQTRGIDVAIGHSPQHLVGVDELVFTPAVQSHEAELQEARQITSLRCRTRGEVLASFVNSAPVSVAVCGSHGKTTTATFVTKLLQALGADPAWCIGGETGSLSVAGTGKGPLVVEADESDGTLELYHPTFLIITSLDYDHPDHFPTEEDYKNCFRKVWAQTQQKVITFQSTRASLFSKAFPLISPVCVCPTPENASLWNGLTDRVLGEHNIQNALLACAAVEALGFSHEEIQRVFPSCVKERPNRRFQEVIRTPNVQVFTDYAHHPTEIKATLQLARTCAPARMRVIFQPHRYSRTRTFLNAFPPALAQADEIVLAPVYAAFEEPLEGGESADLYGALRHHPLTRQKPILLARTLEEAWNHLFLTRQPGDLLLLMGAGDIISLVPRAVKDLSNQPVIPSRSWTPLAPFSFFRTGGQSCGGGKKVPIGMGSNLWLSDCATQTEYVRLPSVHPEPLHYGAGFPGAALEIPWMTGIPGTLGGWVKMNAGAFGHSISEVVSHIKVDGKLLCAQQCHFAYRSSSIEGMITDVILDADALAHARAQGTCADYRALRHAFPPRTCGCVFKNPPPPYPSAGFLLEQAGVQKYHVGGASVWHAHANVIVAGEGCTSSDILALARLMARRVFLQTGLRLEPEIQGLTV